MMTKEKALKMCHEDLIRIGSKQNVNDYIAYTLPVLCKYINIENVDILVGWMKKQAGIESSRYYRELWKCSSPKLITGYKFTQQLAFLLDYIMIENSKMMQEIYAGTYPA